LFLFLYSSLTAELGTNQRLPGKNLSAPTSQALLRGNSCKNLFVLVIKSRDFFCKKPHAGKCSTFRTDLQAVDLFALILSSRVFLELIDQPDKNQ